MEADEAKKPLPSQSAILKANKKGKTASNVFAKFKIVFNSFVADKSSLKAEAARERGEEGRGRKSGEAKVRRIKNFS